MKFDWARKLSDRQWAEALIGKPDGRYTVPPMPSEAIQKKFVGSSGMDAFKDPGIFFKETRTIMESYGARLSNNSKILDFGVGWGRFYRWLLRDFSPESIIGADVDPEMITLCKQDMPFGRFEQIPAEPPYTFRDNEFDLIFLYSVFSHLSEESFKKIIKEFERITKPGGFVAFTTLLGRHLDVWASQAEARKHIYDQIGFDLIKWRQKAIDGDFLFVPTGGGSSSRPASFYGEAVITESYLRKFLRDGGYEIACFREDTGLPQAFIVLRKVS